MCRHAIIFFKLKQVVLLEYTDVHTINILATKLIAIL